ncbi:MAG: DUF433 domain-containing protein [Chloroflexi bacterium]|nr:DUF433 domain-containing protein [Chloroflexota bacterium]
MIASVLDRHILIDPNVCHGRPHIDGTRIRVQDIAIWHERLGMSVDEISAAYDLSFAQIYAALAYYFEYKVSVDQAIDADRVYFEAFKENNPSRLQEKLRQLRG